MISYLLLYLALLAQARLIDYVQVDSGRNVKKDFSETEDASIVLDDLVNITSLASVGSLDVDSGRKDISRLKCQRPLEPAVIRAACSYQT